MATKFLLLCPLTADDFTCTTDEMIEAVEEFGCKVVSSLDTQGQVRYYATATTQEALLQMCSAVELNGSMVEYSALFDQVLEA